MMKLIFWAILIYLLYRLIFGFIIPVSKATRQIKSKIREAQANQQRFQQQHQQNVPRQEQFQKNEPKPSDSEYIDYEEVK
jgi:sortase (surface protein transpeptidase)